MTLKAVLFDIGDTLWGYPWGNRDLRDAHYARARLLLDRATDVPPAEALAEAIGLRFAEAREASINGPEPGVQPPTASLVAEALSQFGLQPPPDRLALFIETAFEWEVQEAAVAPPEPEMAEVLAALEARGLALACVSNTFLTAEGLARMLEHRGLGGFFRHVVSSADAGFRKPHPKAFLPALEAVDVAPEEAAFVGDRLDMDIAGARAVGMTAVLTTQYRQEDAEAGPVRPDVVISHLGELVPYVDSRLGR